MKVRLKSETEYLAKKWKAYELERLRIMQEHVLILTNLEMHTNANVITRTNHLMTTTGKLVVANEWAVVACLPGNPDDVDQQEV